MTLTAESVVYREKTAIRRHQLSRPVSLALRDGVFTKGDSFFDYGCGLGEDVEYLRGMGIQAAGWDPKHRPSVVRSAADVVNLGYVINVVENPEERATTLKEAYVLARGVLVVSAMIGYRSRNISNAIPYSDGYLTLRGTFQKYFHQDELAEYLTSVLGTHAYAADIGTYYVFRDEVRESAYCRILVQEPVGSDAPRSRIHVQLHPDTLCRIAAEVRRIGRLPLAEEFPDEAAALGILASSDDWLSRLSEHLQHEEVEAIRRVRRGQLLLTLAPSYFSPSGKQRLADMSVTLRADVRSVFGSISRAYRETEEFINQVMDCDTVSSMVHSWGMGKITPSALYLHVSLEPDLPFELRALVACGRAMANDALPEEVNLLKISHQQLGVSFAYYREFDDTAHPPLVKSVRADFESGRVGVRDYSNAPSPPILHRKDLLVGGDHLRLSEFRALSLAEEKLGLLGRRDIGALQPWRRLLVRSGVEIAGHTLTVDATRGLQDPEVEPSTNQLAEVGDDETDDEFQSVGDESWIRRTVRSVRRRPKNVRSRVKWTDEALRTLAQSVHSLGRPPLEGEVGLPSKMIRRFLTVKDWKQTLGPWFDRERYEETRRHHWSEWIVALGSNRFGGRTAVRRLSLSHQADVKYLFGSYRQACAEADQWLFRIGNSEAIQEEILSWPKGRHHEEKGLYVHSSLEPQLPVLIRLLLSCGRHLASRALPHRIDVVRVALNGANVKFYEYENFDQPDRSRLIQTAKVDFRRRRVIARRCDEDARPRYLLRKDDLVDSSYPLHAEFAQMAITDSTQAVTIAAECTR